MTKKIENIGIIIPLANESKTLVDLYNAIDISISHLKEKYTVYFVVDKASRDNTKELCEDICNKDDRFVTVWGENNKNAIDAYMLGYKVAFDNKHDAFIEMDGGLSHDPKEIAVFTSLLNEGYECVFGCRFALGGEIKDSRISRHFLSRAGTTLSNFLLGMHFNDGTSGFIGLRKSALKLIFSHGIRSKSHFYQTEMRFILKNLKWIETPIYYKSPSASVSSKSIKNSIYLLIFYTIKRILW